MAISPGLAAAEIIQMPKTGRTLRVPVHNFNIQHTPFALQPFMIAPVLPGDTMKNALCSYSALTKPIKNALIGWWLEHWIFYVPFRAMPASSYLQTMVLDPAFGDLDNSQDAAAATDYYHAQTGDPSFVQQCLQAIVEDKFRNEGEAWNVATAGGLPQVGLIKKTPFSSMALDSATGEPDTLPGMGDDDPNLDVILGTGGATNFAGAYDAYQALVAAQVLDVTFEDWLKSYGVKMPKRHDDDPEVELLRYYKDWQFPGSTVNPTDGSLANAVKWRDSYRADKDRRFKEPGFIVGLTCATPKVYMSKQTQVMVDSLKRSLDWLPAILADQPFTSMKLFTSNGTNSGNGPLGFTPSADYWIDLRDLFTNGDQFTNYSLSATDQHFVSLPTSALATRFVTASDINNLFSTSPAGANIGIMQEGQCRLSILSQVVDYTPDQ